LAVPCILAWLPKLLLSAQVVSARSSLEASSQRMGLNPSGKRGSSWWDKFSPVTGSFAGNCTTKAPGWEFSAIAKGGSISSSADRRNPPNPKFNTKIKTRHRKRMPISRARLINKGLKIFSDYLHNRRKSRHIFTRKCGKLIGNKIRVLHPSG
jgi:hypothetical protein